MPKKVLESLHEAVLNGDPNLAREAAREALKEKIEPLEAIENGLVKGAREVGEKYSEGALFLPDLIMGGEAFKAGLEVLEPELSKRKVEMKTIGTVVLGTVAGDIHCLGKDIVATLLSAAGFKVYNIGVDVPVEKFIESVKKFKPDILGASALMSTTIPEQQKIIEALRKAGLRDKVKFMIGGAATSERWAKQIGADAWAPTADEAVKKAKEILKG